MKDYALKRYFKQNNYFADVCNYLLHQGQTKIQEEDLEDKDSMVAFLNREMRRDIAKTIVVKKDEENTYIVFGIENQTSIDYGMVVRTLAYDVAGYYEQMRKRHEEIKQESIVSSLLKEDKLKPVITIVIYYGEKKWDGVVDFKKIVEYKKEYEKYIPNYQMQMIDVKRLKKEELNKFKSNVRYLFGAIKYEKDRKRLGKYLKDNKEYFKEVNETDLEVMNAMLKTTITKEEGGKTNMCKAFEDQWKYGVKQGIKQGKVEGKKEGIIEGKLIGKANGIRIGKKQGITEGINQRNKEIAQKMLEKGMDKISISEITGLTIRQIQYLSKKILQTA